RCLSDWSSDVCSSDLSLASIVGGVQLIFGDIQWRELPQDDRLRNLRRAFLGVVIAAPILIVFAALFASADPVFGTVLSNLFNFRSEERRVGKECRCEV